MGFLAPAFLAGLAALAVPVLLHLVDRVDSRGRRFPSLMFVRRLPYRTRRRRTLRDRLLLLLRCLLLAAVALAFARPFVAGEATPAAVPTLDRVLLIDRSYSMATADRWQRAVAAAAAELDSLPGGARVALLLFDTGVAVVHGLDDPPAAARGALRRAAPGVARGDLASALAGARALLAESQAERREVVLVSDLQRVLLADDAAPVLPDDIGLRVVGVGGGGVVNASVDVLEARAGRDGGDGLLRLRVADRGDRPPPATTLTLAVDGRLAVSREVSLAGAASVDVALPLPAASNRPLRVSASIAGDDLAADDRVDLVLAPDAPLSLLLVEPDGVAASRGVFVTRALAVSGAPVVAVRRTAASALDAGALAAADVIVLDDVEPGDATLLAALRARVEAGVGLLLVAGERLGNGWPDGVGDWWPGRPSSVREVAAAGGARLAWLDPLHPLAATVAEGVGASLAAGVRRYRQVEPAPGDALLAGFDDGAAALLERSVGAGRVMLFTTTLDPRWNDLPASPLFAPLLVEMVHHLAARGAPRDAYRVGEVVDLARHAAAQGAAAAAARLRAGAGAVAELPDGTSTAVPDGLLPVVEPGFHDVHVTGGDTEPVALAVVVDTRESDAELLDEAALLARVARTPASAGDLRAAAERRLADSGDDRGWWWLLLAALLLAAAETWLAARSPRGGTT